MGIWVIADTHFQDEFLIRSGQRPFPTIRSMNEALISAWNRWVRPDDDIWHLGDVAAWDSTAERHRRRVVSMLQQLHGRKFLIMGQQDRVQPAAFWREAGFAEVYDQPVALGTEGRVILSHEPVHLGEAWLNVHGYLHDKDPSFFKMREDEYACVSVEHTDYGPISLLQLIAARLGEDWSAADIGVVRQVRAAPLW